MKPRIYAICGLWLAFAPLLGCADSKLAARDGAFDAESDDTAGGESIADLRVDVQPSDHTMDQGRQSYLPPKGANLEALEVQLAETVVFAGRVTGFDATPVGVPAEVGVPGEDDAPVVARVRAWIPGTATDVTLATSDGGTFAQPLPASLDYRLAIVPVEPAELPLVIYDDFELIVDSSESYYVDYGTPVYGRVLQSDLEPTDGPVRVFLEDQETGVAGSATWLDDQGHFMLRAVEGEYDLVVEGDATSPQPRVVTGISIEDGSPLEVDVDVGIVEAVPTRGRILDSRGREVKDAVVRFTSRNLTQAAGSSSVESETDASGLFNVDLLVGSWTAELFPPYEPNGNSSPMTYEFEVMAPGSLDLGEFELPPRTAIKATVLDPDGLPAGSVLVSAQEQGYDNYIYSAVTDSDGRFSLEVPDVPLTVTLTPSDATAAITHVEVDEPANWGADLWLEAGSPVAGRVIGPTGDAVDFALIEMRNTAGDLFGTSFTDGDGNFTLRVSGIVAR